MIYDVRTPDEYLNELADDWRKPKLLALREIIMRSEPALTERIDYKMLAFGEGDDNVFHLNAQKGYVSLYVGNASKIDPDGVLLEGLNVGKGCIRFSKSVDLSKTHIEEFIQRAIKMWKAGEDFGC